MPTQNFFSSRFHYTFAPHAPTLRVASGGSLRVVCPDSDNTLCDGSILPDDRRQVAPAGLFAGNPMAGPVFVEGAAAGDCLAVRIDAIELDRSTGQTGLAPAHGELPMHMLLENAGPGAFVPSHVFRWRIDLAAGVAEVVNPVGSHPIRVRLDPFVGCIGVCPQWGQAVSTLFCGTFGGNMDIPSIRPGATLYLPVFVEGALLMMGDVHAAQGQGEIIGGGIETSGKIHCTLRLIKSRPLPGPRVRDATRLMAIGVDGDLRAAIQQAYARLIDWLSVGFGLNRWDAYNLVSQTGSIVLGGLGMTPHAVAAAVPIDALPPFVSDVGDPEAG